MKCKYCNEKEASARIRTFPICQLHYLLFKKDNMVRIKKGIDIPKELIILGDEK